MDVVVSGSSGLGAASNSAVSSNWAGYAVTGRPGGVRHFNGVAGSWVQPAVSCTPGSDAYSAFWIGLGGLSQSSRKLEQTGTEWPTFISISAQYRSSILPSRSTATAMPRNSSVSGSEKESLAKKPTS